jgi:hypothetical protein
VIISDYVGDIGLALRDGCGRVETRSAGQENAERQDDGIYKGGENTLATKQSSRKKTGGWLESRQNAESEWAGGGGM